MSRSILTAVAWPYANGPRHVGHVAGFGVPSDIFSRYQRMIGNRVLMVSGTDEHGTPIQVQADREGVSARELADRYNRVIAEDLQGLGLSYDLFTRTTTRNHYAVVQQVFRALHANGYVTEQTQLSAIDPVTKRGLPDRYVEGTCPICGDDGARGDQCDSCGNQLDPQDLVNPRSKIDGATPEFVQSAQFFLELPAFAEALGAWLDDRTDWRPNVLKFSKNLLDDLRPRAISRDLDWGVPIPLEGWEGRNDKRLYVWFDAVIGYLSASVEWARRTGGSWEDFWRGDAESFYFMGKDNVVFHSVIWPAILLGASGKPSGTPGPYGDLALPSEVVSLGVPHHGGAEVQLLPVGRHLRPRRARAVRPGCSPLLPGGRRAGVERHRLHVGAVRHPQQHRAGRGLGQPGQPHPVAGQQERRQHPACR